MELELCSTCHGVLLPHGAFPRSPLRRLQNRCSERDTLIYTHAIAAVVGVVHLRALVGALGYQKSCTWAHLKANSLSFWNVTLTWLSVKQKLAKKASKLLSTEVATQFIYIMCRAFSALNQGALIFLKQHSSKDLVQMFHFLIGFGSIYL